MQQCVLSSQTNNIFENKPATLDGIAAMLNGIDENSFYAAETGGISLLKTIKDSLFDIIKTSSELVESLITDVIKKIDDLLENRAADPKETLAAIGRIIDAATTYSEIDLMGGGGNASENGIPAFATETTAGECLDEETQREFTGECSEHIEIAEMALLNLESNPLDAESINSIFRAFHTIKGSSAYLNLKLISELAHHAESMLVKIRDGELKYDNHCACVALRTIDILKILIFSSDGIMTDKPREYDELINDIQNVEFFACDTDENKKRAACEKSASAKSCKNITETGKEASVRIRTEKLDRLIDTVGEIVIAHSMVLQDQIFLDTGCNEFSKKITQVGNLVRELQDISMSMRMVQFKSSFQKMSRLVHDLSQKMDKTIEFETSGSDTEVDRNIVDIINEALVHMVRNAIDHGIEMSAEREAAGKPPAGKITLSAYHANGFVVVELRDDGRGLNCGKILEKARTLGIIRDDDDLPPESIYNLILEPGFSTAETVTDISGRGVGMDVVKKSIETLHGKLWIESTPGRGCRFILKTPLTLAVTDGMLVRVGKQRFIVQTNNIQMTFRPEKEMIFTVSESETAVMLHNRAIPILNLFKKFAITGAIEDPLDGIIMVIENGASKIAMLVDEIIGQYQFVARPLGGILGNISGISGGAILGDGKVGLIIDPLGIVD